jgi:anti-sigma-K factor RskA
MAAKKREELLDLIAAYALGALDEDERTEFESWLKDDLEAQAILADYHAIAGHLLTLVPLRPAPDHLQADLRQRLAASPRRKTPVRRGMLSKRQRVWILAAAALLVVAILGVLLTSLRSVNEATPTPVAADLYAQLVAQASSSKYTVVAGEVDAAVSGNMIVSSDGKQAVLCIWSLPTITSDQIFQMWLIDTNGARTSGGLFQADPSQAAMYIQVPLDQPVTDYKGVGVSLEPAGGSPYADQPTGPRVLSVPLSS